MSSAKEDYVSVLFTDIYRTIAGKETVILEIDI